MGTRDENMVTIGQRRLGKKIRKLENSVELSSKEGKAKLAEQKYKQKMWETKGYPEDYTVENLTNQNKKENRP